MNAMVGDIIEDGGEGGIMRRVGSLYEPGRTTTLLKLKVLHSSLLIPPPHTISSPLTLNH